MKAALAEVCPVPPLPIATGVVAVSVVNAPELGVTFPIAGVFENNEMNPLPDTAPDADSVLNAPAAGVPLPIDGGVAALAVANVPNATPPVFVHVIAPPLVAVQSPDNSE